VRLVLWQVAVDDGRFRRAVELVLDIVDFGNLRQFGDVQRAVLEGHAVRPIKAGDEDFDLALSVLVDDRIDLVLQA
jgi:hypothetical protein